MHSDAITNLRLQVENELFKVAREGFENSSKFVGLYKVSASAKVDSSTEAIYELGSIEIPDVKANEFTAFLKILIKP